MVEIRILAYSATASANTSKLAGARCRRRVNGVIIYVDQTTTENWNEIDAVRLIGRPVSVP
jgi:hypothetical protein